MIPYENLAKVNEPFHQEFENRFSRFLEKGWYILGEEVQRFEQQFADYIGVQYGIGVANGLDALVLSLTALDLPEHSEVIVPSNTYIASILAILRCGHIPVLVEPDIRTYNIDPAGIEAVITPATGAILVVHLYGKCCDMDPILNLASKHGLAVVEDCAQSHGARYKGRMAGTFGILSAFSFYPSKNLGALGDAGAVLTNNDPLKTELQMLRNYGSQKKYYNERIGYNSRLDELQAIFLQVKLAGLEQINRHKRKLAGLYLSQLKSDFILPVAEEGYEDVYHIFNIRHPERDRLRSYLLQNGIGTEIHYPVPPHRQNALKDLLQGAEFPISDQIHATTLSLPVSCCHSEADIERVIAVLNAF
ncbi:MAG: DegT/DnrJ/EryC1/StrS family aminotransferase [Sediminibacterium sp.]|nr:DegT/DnrJ/EryC1/StrS family aminotransferase [Sediminibacterium sp.]